jgi:hypothetical protein
VEARGAYFEGVTQWKYSQEIPFCQEKKEKRWQALQETKCWLLHFVLGINTLLLWMKNYPL